MISFISFTIPAASLGELNPTADIRNNTYIHATYEVTDKVTEEEKQYLGVGMLQTMLPYQMQDGYDRERKPRAFRAAVVENAYLRATFLPEIGGRLWSLYDKVLKKELLYRNSVFQPANLALRNAWFSGGVEFNVGIKGHTPLTCSPLFCEIGQTPDGEVLSLYEYERIRGVVYSVSAWLPENSRVLYLKCRIENRTDEVKHMYWWSNIAVPETPETRIVVPADETFVTHYQEDHYVFDKSPVPHCLGTEVSYPVNVPFSHDFFFKIPKERRKWIAAVQKDGTGLLQCSTDRLRGRKLFVWGQRTGGRHWGEWLSEPGQSYVEIQAGLANTQMEHIPMPPQTEWSWVEAYSALEGDPQKLYSKDWHEAGAEAERCVLDRVGETRTLYFPDDASVTARRTLLRGSGWGALEETIRGQRISEHFTFDPADAARDPETAQWAALLADGTLPAQDAGAFPPSYVTGEFWKNKLEALPEQNWYTLMQYGCVLYAGGDTAAAEAAWLQSYAAAENPWAVRNLAMLERNEYKRPERACELIVKALRLLPTCRAIAVEAAQTLTANGRDAEWLALDAELDPALREHGRIRLYRVIALLNLDRVREAAAILTPDFVLSDVKEGELSVSALWFRTYRALYALETGRADEAAADAKYPLPKALDFRMS